MDLNYIESLAIKSKSGDTNAKEEITKEFTPFIRYLAIKTHIPGYDSEDILNECYISLLKALDVYNTEKHTFVAYAINSIKNNLNYLIRKTLNNKTKSFEDVKKEFPNCTKDIDNNLLRIEEIKEIQNTINLLTPEEYDLFTHLIVKNRPIQEYAYSNNILYQTVYNKKKKLLKKIASSLSSLM